MENDVAITALAALAQETRLDIHRLLVETGPEGLPAGRIAERLGLPLPPLSIHLAQLKQARLVSARRESRSIIYAADFGTMTGLVAYLTENCCGGDSARCGIAATPSSETMTEGAAGHEATARPRRR